MPKSPAVRAGSTEQTAANMDAFIDRFVTQQMPADRNAKIPDWGRGARDMIFDSRRGVIPSPMARPGSASPASRPFPPACVLRPLPTSP